MATRWLETIRAGDDHHQPTMRIGQEDQGSSQASRVDIDIAAGLARPAFSAGPAAGSSVAGEPGTTGVSVMHDGEQPPPQIGIRSDLVRFRQCVQQCLSQ
jgi:hypothetical protein